MPRCADAARRIAFAALHKKSELRSNRSGNIPSQDYVLPSFLVQGLPSRRRIVTGREKLEGISCVPSELLSAKGVPIESEPSP